MRGMYNLGIYIYICMQHLEENCYCDSGGIELPLLLDRIKRYLENYFRPFFVRGIDPGARQIFRKNFSSLSDNNKHFSDDNNKRLNVNL